MIRYVLIFVTLLAPLQVKAESHGFKETPCPEGITGGGTRIVCGNLSVAEDRSDPASPKVDLRVVVLKAPAEVSKADPVVFLSGGPGQSAVDTVESWSSHPLAKQRDVILMDLKGLGRSSPLCPGLSKELFKVMAADLSVEEEITRHVAAARACRLSLKKRGARLTAYGSLDSAADLEQLRRAMGYEKWNLLGVSYGARLALTVMREHPDSLRSVILDSPLALEDDFYRSIPEDFQRGLEQLSTECEEGPSCGENAGTLMDEYEDLLSSLRRTPLVIPLADFSTGKFVLNHQDFKFFMAQFLHSSTMRPVLPALIRATRQKPEIWAPLIRVFTQVYSEIDIGMYYAVQCREELPFARPVTREGKAIGIIGASHAVCREWNIASAPAKENQPVKSDIPTLILSGALDTRTPTRRLGPLEQNLTRSHMVTLANSGHGVYTDACAKELIASFLANPGDRPTDQCVAPLKPAALVGQVTLRGGVLKLLRMFTRQQYAQLAGAVASLVLLGLVFVGWPLLCLIRRLRRPGNRPRRLHAIVPWSIWLAGMIALTFGALLTSSVFSTFAAQPALILLGLPSSAAPFFILPKLLALIALVGGMVLLVAWRRAGWSRLVKAHYILSLSACSYLLLFLLRLDLL